MPGPRTHLSSTACGRVVVGPTPLHLFTIGSAMSQEVEGILVMVLVLVRVEMILGNGVAEVVAGRELDAKMFGKSGQAFAEVNSPLAYNVVRDYKGRVLRQK